MVGSGIGAVGIGISMSSEAARGLGSGFVSVSDCGKASEGLVGSVTS